LFVTEPGTANWHREFGTANCPGDLDPPPVSALGLTQAARRVRKNLDGVDVSIAAEWMFRHRSDIRMARSLEEL
jgi:hypothetical protein